MRATRVIKETCYKHDAMYHGCEIKINETPEKNYKEIHIRFNANAPQNSMYIRINTDECKLLAKKLYRDIKKSIKTDEKRINNSILKPYHSPINHNQEIEPENFNTEVEFPNELTFQSKMNYEHYDMYY